MAWAVHARRVSAQERRARVKASWMALAAIEDVVMRSGDGVHLEGITIPFRREMTAFSKPLEAFVHWDEGVETPELILEWDDNGYVAQERVPLTFRSHHRGLHVHLGHHNPLRGKRSQPTRGT